MCGMGGEKREKKMNEKRGVMQLEHAWWDFLFSLSLSLPLFSDFSPLIPVQRAFWDMPRQLPLSSHPTVFV